MVNKPYLVRIDDNTIVNLENVSAITRTGSELSIYLVSEPHDPSYVLYGDQAEAMWLYFSSAMMSFRPLKITNPGRETLDKTQNSTDAD
ncbi:hypothetical protein VF14_36730 [Nostoc linckia z18]|jgi:hypothetical protein|uniref:hypothetical protein n=1 Tax=Nostoc linckia TaxID=92942 RepID=UPI000BFFE07D|nr:hypothetical protein [Nostoc linckia]PHJ74820.1 hypothetical protein VF07_37695 [Nostoc linckia z6]PHJ55756.1 hypothetical protein VF02_35525 [Nostoc linckia z1]PHJ56019.1 hypothetical protein VF03_37940 [Nostoc linckia z2]PHJ57063.1 hypothetical protein VF05_36280 [Nostoc linckia z3]PHJ73172.1 hypothetical protein VF06_36095 [Nostoc linckia z4]